MFRETSRAAGTAASLAFGMAKIKSVMRCDTAGARESLRDRLRLIGMQGMLLCVPLLAVASGAGPTDDLSLLDLHTLMGMDVTLVSAQKRLEDVNSVPISMVVVKSDAIDNMHLQDTADLQTAVPGLTTTTSFDFVLPYIRGVGTDITANGIEPSVAVYVDGVYQSDRTETWVDLYDVDQIEVLKGPQGTLYGRNATGGAININTRAPTDTFTGYIQATGGNFELRDSTLFVSGPLGDRLKVSISAHLHERDGDVRNLYNGEDVNNENYRSVHGRLQLDLTSTLRAELLVKYFNQLQGTLYNTALSNEPPDRPLDPPVTTRPFYTYSTLSNESHGLDNSTTALKINWDPGSLRLQSITSYNEQRQLLESETQSTFTTFQDFFIYDSAHWFTQEIQITPAGSDSKLNWLAGAFEINSAAALAPIAAYITTPTVSAFESLVTGEVTTQASAAFGEITWSFTDAFSMTGGLRYSNEVKKLENTGTGTMGSALTYIPDESHRWDAVNYRVVAKYTMNQTLFYAKTETAFKSGAYNDLNPRDPGPIDPEKITAYEIGVKTPVADFPMWIDVAAFYNDYRDLQLQVTEANGNGLTSFVQAPRAVAYGLDANVHWRVSPHWNVESGISLLDAKYREFDTPGILVPSPSGGNVPAPTLELDGNRLSRSPALTGNIAATYTRAVGTGTASAGVNYYHSSRLYFDPANRYSQSSYDLLGAHLDYNPTKRWHLAGWARNLTNTTYLSAVNLYASGTLAKYSDPRTYGLTFGYSFGN